MTKTCPECSIENSDESFFCKNCGNNIKGVVEVRKEPKSGFMGLINNKENDMIGFMGLINNKGNDMMFCPECGAKNEYDSIYCIKCRAKLKNQEIADDNVFKLNFLEGTNRFDTILKDGTVSKLNKDSLTSLRYKFDGTEYFFEETRIIAKIGENFGYMPYKDIIRVRLFLDDKSVITVISLNGVFSLSTSSALKALQFTLLLEVASTRAGFQIPFEQKEALKFRGGGIAIGF